MSARDPPPRVLLGVMSNPVKPAMRAQQRKWAGHFQHAANVDVRFVLGTTFFNNTQRPPPEWDELKAEEKEHKDIIFVEGREKLPHAGVVTEKMYTVSLCHECRPVVHCALCTGDAATATLQRRRRCCDGVL